MKTSLRSLLVLAGLTTALNASAADCCKATATSACCATGQACCSATPVATAATPAAYPLTTCVVSGEKLGDMGKPFEYVYKKEGQPDRTVLLCCKGCVKDFEADPAKYLKLLDEAAAAKTKV